MLASELHSHAVDDIGSHGDWIRQKTMATCVQAVKGIVQQGADTFGHAMQHAESCSVHMMQSETAGQQGWWGA